MKTAYKILFLVIIPEIIAEFDPLKIGPTIDYCKVKSCRHPHKHTGCAYFEKNESGYECPHVYRVETNKFKESEKEDILRRHNEIRQYVVANRTMYIGRQPRPAFMPNLTWDDELAFLAQTWVNQCSEEPMYDECRDVARFRVGQNIAFGGTVYFRLISTVTEIIDAWYSRRESYNGHTVYNNIFQDPMGAYVQMVWADTRVIGCGRLIYAIHRRPKYRWYSLEVYFRNIFICNYGPAAIYEHQKITPGIGPEVWYNYNI